MVEPFAQLQQYPWLRHSDVHDQIISDPVDVAGRQAALVWRSSRHPRADLAGERPLHSYRVSGLPVVSQRVCAARLNPSAHFTPRVHLVTGEAAADAAAFPVPADLAEAFDVPSLPSPETLRELRDALNVDGH
jgi:hypothetical protein